MTLKQFKIVILVGLFSCVSPENKKEALLYTNIKDLDSLMRLSMVDLNELENIINKLNLNFSSATQRSVNEPLWRSNIIYKWNTDSSISMILSNKYYHNDLKREKILHINDSILFIQRFISGPAQSNSTQVNFVETIDYLTPTQTIKTLYKIKNYENYDDSIQFKLEPFNDLSKSVQEHYGFELDYCRDIVNRN